MLVPTLHTSSATLKCLCLCLSITDTVNSLQPILYCTVLLILFEMRREFFWRQNVTVFCPIVRVAASFLPGFQYPWQLKARGNGGECAGALSIYYA